MTKRPDTPCSGCGKLLYTGPGSLPQPTCRECRAKRRPERRNQSRTGWQPAKAHYVRCGSEFVTKVPWQRFCRSACQAAFWWNSHPEREREKTRAKRARQRSLRLVESSDQSQPDDTPPEAA